MKPILIVWQEVPETTKVYLVTPRDEEEEAMILASNNIYVNNSDDDKPALWLNEFLADKEILADDESSQVMDLPECRLLMAGFIL